MTRDWEEEIPRRNLVNYFVRSEVTDDPPRHILKDRSGSHHAPRHTIIPEKGEIKFTQIFVSLENIESLLSEVDKILVLICSLYSCKSDTQPA